MKTLYWITNKASSTGGKKEQNTLLSLDDVRNECLTAMSQIDSLSNHRWHFFRKLLNEYDFESREFAVNRAFYKLWEILCLFPPKKCDDAPTIRTLHLAEAPGSFVQVVKKLYPDASCVAISKPPSTYAEVVQKNRSIPVFSNNVLCLQNCQFLYMDLLSKYTVRKFTADNEGGFDLITADGGFDEEERYDAKETLHYNLILAEIIYILMNQRKGGQCVLKIFETFTDTSLYIMWLLCEAYTSFEIIKPSTSRPTNAERYIVCMGYKGHDYSVDSLLSLMDAHITRDMILDIQLPEHYVKKMEDACRESTRLQIDTINKVMEFVHEKAQGRNGSIYIDKRQFVEQKKRSFEEWKSRFGHVGENDVSL